MQYILFTILLTVYGQLTIKWQVISAGEIPQLPSEKMMYFIKLLINPWVISTFAAAFLAGISWMIAMNRLQLSYAYPFLSLSFVFVLILSSLIFYEPITWQKVVGLVFIMLGVCISAKS